MVMVGVIASVFLLTISGLLLASAVLASHRARTAAELAAPPAAGLLVLGQPCSASFGWRGPVAPLNPRPVGD